MEWEDTKSVVGDIGYFIGKNAPEPVRLVWIKAINEAMQRAEQITTLTAERDDAIAEKEKMEKRAEFWRREAIKNPHVPITTTT